MLKRLADRCGTEWITYFGELQDVEYCEVVGGEVEITHRLTDRAFRVKAKVPPQTQAEDFVKVAPAPLLPFAALMEGIERPFIKTLARAIMESDLSDDRKQDLLVMTTFFFARFFGMEIVQEDIQMSLFEPNPLAEYYEQRGLQKGKQEGIQEGLQEGIQKGKQEIVLRMLGREMPPQVVAELTGFSLQEVLALREQAASKQKIARKMLERGFSIQEVSTATDLPLSAVEDLCPPTDQT